MGEGDGVRVGFDVGDGVRVGLFEGDGVTFGACVGAGFGVGVGFTVCVLVAVGVGRGVDRVGVGLGVLLEGDDVGLAPTRGMAASSNPRRMNSDSDFIRRKAPSHACAGPCRPGPRPGSLKVEPGPRHP